jgi:hypothetical protein
MYDVILEETFVNTFNFNIQVIIVIQGVPGGIGQTSGECSLR